MEAQLPELQSKIFFTNMLLNSVQDSSMCFVEWAQTTPGSFTLFALTAPMQMHLCALPATGDWCPFHILYSSAQLGVVTNTTRPRLIPFNP